MPKDLVIDNFSPNTRMPRVTRVTLRRMRIVGMAVVALIALFCKTKNNNISAVAISTPARVTNTTPWVVACGRGVPGSRN